MAERLVVSPPDAHGYCSMGTSVIALPTAIETAKVVIAQINSAMPRTLGDSFVHVDDIDFGVLLPDALGPPAVDLVQQAHRFTVDAAA